MNKEDKEKAKTLAILALILNLIILPGVGSIVGGRVKTGIWQIALSVGGIVIIIMGAILTATILLAIIGIPLIVIGALMPAAAWIWGLVTGIQLLSEN